VVTFPIESHRLRRLGIVAAMLVLIIVAVLVVGRLDDRGHPAPEVEIVGPEVTVFDWSEQACETDDFPDVPARAFRDAQGQVQLIASHFVNRRMVGPALDDLVHDCDVILASDNDPNPARFNDREWIHAVYALEDGTVFALLHNEYQGHRHEGQCPQDEYRPCWYNAVTLAVSTDGGTTYTHVKPPDHLVASVPYQYEPGAGPFGIFNPSNIVRSPDDGFYYALLNVPSYEAQQGGVCLMRTDDLTDPASWRAWDGSEFSVSFINPYAEPNADSADHVCQPVAREEIQTLRHSVTYNTYLDRFLLVGMAPVPQPGSNEPSWGIFFSLSDDLIHWTPRRLIMETEVQWTFQCGDEHPIGFPSVLDPDSESRNFETTDNNFNLYFVQFNYSSCEPTPDRDLVRVAIELSR
jgi:hypothetical protein